MPRDTVYGFPAADWALAREQATSFLIRCARRRVTTTYSDLCREVTAVALRPYSFAMVAFLDQICLDEDAAHGTVLASLVTRKDTGLPGEGYFAHAARQGWDVSDRRAAWRSQIDRIHEQYPPIA